MPWKYESKTSDNDDPKSKGSGNVSPQSNGLPKNSFSLVPICIFVTKWYWPCIYVRSDSALSNVVLDIVIIKSFSVIVWRSSITNMIENQLLIINILKEIIHAYYSN